MDNYNREETFEKIKDAALTYLSYGMRTEKQMRLKLKEKGFDKAAEECIIDDVIDFLKEYSFINDEKYAISYIEYAISKGHGRIKIRNALRERGINVNVIEDAFYEYEKQNDMNCEATMSEAERALNEAMKTVDGHDIDDKLIAKVGRKLKSRGFESEAIYYAVGRIMNMKKSENDELD